MDARHLPWKTVFAGESNAVGGLAREWRHSPQGRVTHLQNRLPSYSAHSIPQRATLLIISPVALQKEDS